MIKNFIRNNVPLISIILFLFFFILLIVSKPPLVFNKNGLPRDFGLGNTNKTIVPLWLSVIILAILSYFAIIYYLSYKKFAF